MAFAAGAREVFMPIFGCPSTIRAMDLDFLVENSLRERRVECMAFHPLGTAKMSATTGARAW